MQPRSLYIWVEGLDDARLFDVVFKPIFQEQYHHVEVRSYAQLRKTDVNKFLKATPYIPADYIFLGDKDSAPCVTSRKQSLLKEYPALNPDNIIVVTREIEGWYLAGIHDEDCRAIGMKPAKNTDGLQKQQFNQLMPARFDSRIVWMREILETFSIESAKTKNLSFRYFANKYRL
jgi:hypothetical protein